MSSPELNISIYDVQAILPILMLAGFGLAILVLDTLQKVGTRKHLALISAMGFGVTAVTAFIHWHNQTPREVFSGMIYMDGFTQAFTVIFCVAGALTCLLCRDYLVSQDHDKGEFYAVLLFAVMGMVVMTAAADLLTLFLGIETMTISMYVVAGFLRHDKRSAESAMKYLILGALS
ncbi:MAG: hypothetical protein KC561_21170, partial [Myxococcales bacterium]|nr:hypothetical protein [Myxococcales bacterium]